MNLLKWFVFLLIGCAACSKSSTTATPSIDGPYRVTALLNDSTWFGSTYASKTVTVAGQAACTTNRFNVGFSTDIPYTNYPSKLPVTGCTGDCIPTQSLGFRNIPLEIGRYEIATLNSCAGQDGAVTYFWLLGGDGIVNVFTSKTSKGGWIEITGYNSTQNAVEGTFDVELSNQQGSGAHFQKGAFKAIIK